MGSYKMAVLGGILISLRLKPLIFLKAFPFKGLQRYFIYIYIYIYIYTYIYIYVHSLLTTIMWVLKMRSKP